MLMYIRIILPLQIAFVLLILLLLLLM